jgi:V8-like Glu-specific endopeptidase
MLKSIRRALSRVAVLAIASSTLVACSATGEKWNRENDGKSGRAIVNGTEASDYPEAILLNMNGGQYLCSGSLIAPQVVLTAGHCVLTMTSWEAVAPFANNQTQQSTDAVVMDYAGMSDSVDPNTHDVGLVFLPAPINIASYPTIAASPVPDGGQVENIGRIDNGTASYTALYKSQPITVNDAAQQGFPFDYVAQEVIEHGDSGGPDVRAGTHEIVAVNSGAGNNIEILARVDLVASWIQQQIQAHGGPGQNNPNPNPNNPDPNNPDPNNPDPNNPNNPDPNDPNNQNPDPNDPGNGGNGQCGNVTYEGDCQGTTLEYCDGGLEQVDCGQYGLQCGFNQDAGYYDCL